MKPEFLNDTKLLPFQRRWVAQVTREDTTHLPDDMLAKLYPNIVIMGPQGETISQIMEAVPTSKEEAFYEELDLFCQKSRVSRFEELLMDRMHDMLGHEDPAIVSVWTWNEMVEWEFSEEDFILLRVYLSIAYLSTLSGYTATSAHNSGVLFAPLMVIACEGILPAHSELEKVRRRLEKPASQLFLSRVSQNQKNL